MSSTTDDAIPAADRAISGPEILSKPLGFIGLGTMGLPMAVNCARRGIAVLGCDIDPKPMDPYALGQWRHRRLGNGEL